MALKLYPHNQTAYEKAVHMLREERRTAIVHPTGTGKSFIAFKLVEEHPNERFIWLAPSEYIYCSQRENYLAAGGDEAALSSVTFLTYAKLMYALDEMYAEEPKANKTFDNLIAEPPVYIILDEFHRCGAEGWGRGVEWLLKLYPSARILGLSATHIRYLDSRRDMAQELFQGCIASQMELPEAVANGILPAPLYICGLYEYKSEIKKLSRRISRHRNRGVRDNCSELLEKLRYCLQHADGPKEIFARYMKKDGKYILFCTGRTHMEDMISMCGEWFAELDAEPTVYRAVYDNEESPEEVKKFQSDRSSHLKLLYCIDMLNEGIHVADVDGVVLLRPTASPTLYLQQVGRALSVPDKHCEAQPVIFDLVNNFDGLKCIDSFLEGYRKISDKDGGEQKETSQYAFQLVDEARDSRALFDRLLQALDSSWEVCFGEAEKYYKEQGDLKIPKRYITENGISLGSWILTQKRVRAGNVPGTLTKEQIDRLDAIGMEWDNRLGKAWDVGYAELLKFRAENGHVDVDCRFVTEDGYPLGKFVSNQRFAKKRTTGRKLTPERERKLDEIGFIWEKSEQNWDRYYAAAKAFYEREGHLKVPVKYVTEDGLHLWIWLQTKAAAKDTLSEDKVRALEAIGMVWGNRYDIKWDEKYRLAEQYYQKYGNLDVPADYKVEGVNLGRWVGALRSARENPENSHYRLNEERIRQLDKIGMRWTGNHKGSRESWEVRFRLAEQYYQEHGNLRISQAYVTETGGTRIWLGKWIVEQRKKHSHADEKHALTKEQEKKLERIGMEW